MQITSKRLIVALIFSLTALSGCGSQDVARLKVDSTSPVINPLDDVSAAKTLAQMLDVAMEGDWETYVDQYYGEQHKFRTPADRDALILRLEKKWGEQVVQVIGRAVKLPVMIDGDKAMFQDGAETVYILYRDDRQTWKFHL